MEKKGYILYKQYNSIAELKEMDDLLLSNKVRTDVRYEGTFDTYTYNDSPIHDTYYLYIHPADLDRAERIQEEKADLETADVDPGYYLLSFDNEELREVITQSDKWSKHDFVLAKKLLRQRGVQISEGEVQKLKTLRREQLAKEEKEPDWLIWIGYGAIIFTGIISICIGYHLMNETKTQPDGTIAKRFVLSDRVAGRNILVAGIGSLVIWLLAWYQYMYV